MGLLKELTEKPTVIINDEKYVPIDLYKNYLIERLEAEKKDCINQDEKDGIDIAIKCVWNS